MAVVIGARFIRKPGKLRCSDTGFYWERLPSMENACAANVQRALLLDVPPRVLERIAAIQKMRKTQSE